MASSWCQMDALPPPCAVGGRVGIVASSGPVKLELLTKGIKTLRAWGLVPVFYHRQPTGRRPSRPDNADAAANMPLVSNENYDSESDAEHAADDEARRPGSDDLKEGKAAICKQHTISDDPTSGFLAASDLERAAQLASAFADPTTTAVLCIRGGYGIARLLPLVDWTAAARGSGVTLASGSGWRPKRFFGFSDASVIHAALQHGAAAIRTGPGRYPGFGLISFHAPMIATGRFGTLPAADRDRLQAALFTPQLNAELFPPLPGLALYQGGRGAKRRQPKQKQRVVGVLVGGNLSTLASMAGSDWALGAGARNPPPMILALEDENETAIRLDRHFQQLRLSGLLDPMHNGSDCGSSSSSSSSGSDGDNNEDSSSDCSTDTAAAMATVATVGQQWGWPCVVGVVLGQFERTDIVDTDGILYSPHGRELRRQEESKKAAAAAARSRRSSSSDGDDEKRSTNALWCCARLSGGRRRGSNSGRGRGLGDVSANAPATATVDTPIATNRRFGKYDPNPDEQPPQAFFWRRVVGIPSSVPTLWRCAFGHGNPNATLPLGAVCAIDVDVDRGVLELATDAEVHALQQQEP